MSQEQHGRTVGYDLPQLGDVPPLASRVQRLERAMVLLAKHVGNYDWYTDLRDIIHALEDELREAEA